MDKEKNKFVYGILVGLLIGTLCFSIVYLVTKDKKGKVSGKSAATEEQSGNSLDDTTVVENNDTDVVEDSGSAVVNAYNYNLSKRKNKQYLSYREGAVGYGVSVGLDGSAYLSVSATCGDNSNDKLCDFAKKYSDQGLKLNINKVLFVQNVLVGNSGVPYCIFVLENGEIAYYFYGDLGYNGSTNVTKINGLNNIVSVVSDSSSSYVVDINGNEYSLSNYIK